MNRRPAAVRYQDTDVAEAYDRRRFDSLGGRYKNWRLRRLLNKILKSLPPGSTVLDIPCGTGRIDNWLLKTPVRVIASDISRAMLGVARQKVRPTSLWLGFLRADANRLPFRSGSVDGVLSIRFLHLLDQRARLRALDELARVARRWAVVEYRVERPVKAAKRAIIRWCTGRTGRKKMTVADIADERNECGLVGDGYYFISRWFSGSVLVKARCAGFLAERRHVQTRLLLETRPSEVYAAGVTAAPALTKPVSGGSAAIPT